MTKTLNIKAFKSSLQDLKTRVNRENITDKSKASQSLINDPKFFYLKVNAEII